MFTAASAIFAETSADTTIIYKVAWVGAEKTKDLSINN